MQLFLHNIAKSYGSQPLFEPVSIVLNLGDSCAITGPNGSGKTTLLKLLMGYAKPDSGEVFWLMSDQTKQTVDFNQVAFASIQLNLWDDLTVNEAVNLHFNFRKPLVLNVVSEFELLFGKKNMRNKVKQLSAGWLNRLKVYLALFTDTQLLLLDEPFSNMDSQSIEVMKKYILQYANNRILCVASNRQDEIELCKVLITLKK